MLFLLIVILIISRVRFEGRTLVLIASVPGHCWEAPWPSVGLRSERSGIRSSLRSPCCALEQDTFTSQNNILGPRIDEMGLDKMQSRRCGMTPYPLMHRDPNTEEKGGLTFLSRKSQEAYSADTKK